MNERTFRLLEYEKIIEMLAEETSSSLGRELALAWRPSTEIETVKRLQRETAEAKDILLSGERMWLGAIYPIEENLSRAALGGILSGEELFQIASTCLTSTTVKDFLAKHNYPALAAYAGTLTDYRVLVKTIQKAIGDQGEVLDTASDRLASLRRQFRTIQNRIRDKIEQMTRSAEMQKYLQENIFTMRGDRYVLPVKQEFKQMVPGVVHDVSGSGATLFVEPMAIVDFTNQLKQVEAAIEEEITSILKELTAAVRLEAGSIKACLRTLINLDLIMARGKMALRQNAVEPIINQEGLLDLRKARHPLLKGNVVPIDISLGENFHLLVITGPNTGGKTVTLKTVGLITLMAQAGLQVPTASGTSISIFRKIFCDLGDEQSIAQSLSTFSGHITNIIEMIREVQGKDSLVLLDELGAGTDPQEGAALAMALLEFFHRKSVRVIATTHYSELKSFVYNREGFANASMEFDMETLSPTFHLLMGLPGHSNALAIASRLGMPAEIIQNAQTFLAHDVLRVEDMLTDLAREQKQSRENRIKAEQMNQAARALKERYEKELQNLRQEKEKIILRAREEGKQILQNAREEAEEIIRELREQAENQDRDLPALTYKTREALRKGIEKLEGGQDKKDMDTRPPINPAHLKTGGKIYSKKLGQTGYIQDINWDKKEVLVQMGVMKMTLDFADLVEVSEVKSGSRSGTGHGEIGREKGETIAPELHLLGLNVAQAIEITDKYLDDACLAGLGRVRIIHGKGTGILRKEITAYLKKHPRVKKTYLADISEGGLGVTIAELE